MRFFQNVYRWCMHEWGRVPRVVWLAAALFAVGFSAWSTWQYIAFGYIGFDLGIFDQVLWNSAQGRLFEYSFSGSTYLADHRAWALLVLVPLYWLAPHPVTLLVLQAVVVALGAVCAYWAGNAVLDAVASKSIAQHTRPIAAVGALLYLLHPIVQHMTLFEFHLLPLTMPVVFLLIASVYQRRWMHVWLIVIVLWFVREDIALMTAGAGALLVVEAFIRRKRADSLWRAYMGNGLGLLVASVVWFVAMLQIGALLTPEGETKFFVFYEWLGSTPIEALQFMVLHPLQTLAGVFGGDHAVTALVLLSSFCFLPLVRMRLLLPAVCALAPFFFVSEHILLAMLTSQYTAVALPWLFVAALAGAVRVYSGVAAAVQQRRALQAWPVSPTVLVGAAIFSVGLAHILLLSPVHLLPFQSSGYIERDLQQYHQVLSWVEPADAVMTTERFYPRLSHRRHLYPAQQLVSGTRHYSHEAYELPEHIDWLILEQESLLDYSLVFSAEEREGVSTRWQRVIEENDLILVLYTKDIIVYSSASELEDANGPKAFAAMQPWTVQEKGIPEDSEQWKYVGDIGIASVRLDDGVLEFVAQKRIASSADRTDYHVQLVWQDAGGHMLREQVMSVGGIMPTSEWTKGDIYRVHVPAQAPETATEVEVLIGPLRRQTSSGFFQPVAVEVIADEAVSFTLPIE